MSFGFLSFVPFLVLAVLRQRRRDWLTFAAYVIVVSGMVVAVAAAGPGTPLTLAGGLIFLVMGGATTHSLIALRPSAVGDLSSPQRVTQPGQHAVLEAAKARIHQRAEARKLVTSNPPLGRDLRIGRPDLRRNYDDGGLVDVNHVGADMMVQPDEPPLQLTVQQLTAVRDAARSVAGKPGAHVFDDFLIMNGPYRGYIAKFMARLAGQALALG